MSFFGRAKCDSKTCHAWSSGVSAVDQKNAVAGGSLLIW